MYQIPGSQWAQVIDPVGPRYVFLDQDQVKYSSTSSTPVFVDQTCIYGKGTTPSEERRISSVSVFSTLKKDTLLTGLTALAVRVNHVQTATSYAVANHHTLEPPWMEQVLCAGVTSYKATLECEAHAGDLVGAGGGLGSLACQYAKALGYRVLAISSGEQKRRLCIDQLGAEYFVDYKCSKDIVSEVRSITPDGPHAVVVVASAMEPFQAALQYVRFGGTVVMVGLPPGGVIAADVMQMVFRTINIKASYVGTRAETEKALEIFFTEKFFAPFQTVDLKDLPRVFDRMQEGKIIGRTILNIPETTDWLSDISTQWAIPKFRQQEYTLGTYLAYRLEELGVKNVFSVPGDSNMILHDYLLKSSHLRLIGCCNELNAGYAADGYARTSSTKVSVVIVPYMVGGLSILNAICGACSDRLKVIVISGCPNSDSVASSTLLHHTHAPGGKDQALNAFKGVTTAALRLSPSGCPSEALDNALAQCIESSLPVYIEIPNDLVGMSCPSPRPLSELIISPSSQDCGTVQAIVELFILARRPILVIGGLMQSFAVHRLVEGLVEKLGCPVLCQPDARLVSSFHPQYYGIFWPGIVDNNTEIIQHADLVLALGVHWGDLHTFGKFRIDSERHRLIDVQYDSVHLPNGRSLRHSGLRDIIANLMLWDVSAKTYATRQAPEYLGQRSESDMKNSSGSRLTMNGVLENIQGLINEKSTIVADCGQTWFAAIRLSLPSMATCHMQLLYASLGWSLPATLGCQLARPEGRTVLLVGDGAFQMTAQELSTMVRMRLNPIILVFNNLGYKTETVINDGPYNYIANWRYSQFPAVFDEPSHAPGQYKVLPNGNPTMLCFKIMTRQDLMDAVQLVRKEPEKLAFLELCIQPDDACDDLQHLGRLVTGKSSVEPVETASNPSMDDIPRPASLSNAPNPRYSTFTANRLNKQLATSTLNGTQPPTNSAFTEHMITVAWTSENGWGDPELVPHGPISLMPAASVLQYATTCFEGLKVYRGHDGKLRLFRPPKNCARMVKSAARISLPTFNETELLELIQTLCAVDGPHALPVDQPMGELYIRPTLIGTEPYLGVKTPQEALLVIVMSRMTNFGSTSKEIKSISQGLTLSENPKGIIRAWPGGTGSVKIGANYGPSLLAQRHAETSGCDQVIWLTPDQEITEAGTTNLFFIWRTHTGGLQLATPPLVDQLILPGVTRQSILDLARERLSPQTQLCNGADHAVEPLDVSERKITVKDVLGAADEGRLLGAFAVGTASCILPIFRIKFESREITMGDEVLPYVSAFKGWLSDIFFGYKPSPWAVEVREEH
ncbi:pyruvate decarboxylase [Aspergillus terreus]|uniref:Pyruvate decarboxylase n=1 Tax=Aspergillus terreus TaxID=33178 RepID=A0A5M3Z0G0_ASPTE|nr:hypothetical protein ATETN484_0007003600 [Aspergillus terreus]GFF15841.1 pyruvate decarboxylase [Aspergillus terreus]